MKIKDKFEQLNKELGTDLDEFMGLTTFGTLLNLFEEGIEELRDEEITKKFGELLNLVLNKRIKLGEKECVKKGEELI